MLCLRKVIIKIVLLSVVWLFFLCGCQSIPAKQCVSLRGIELLNKWRVQEVRQHWVVDGIILVKSTHRNFSANFVWKQLNQHEYVITILYPLSLGAITVHGNSRDMVIRTPQGIRKIDNPDKFFLTAFGLDLPISALYYWIQGLSAPTMDISLVSLCNNKLSMIIQHPRQAKHDSWKVTFNQYVSVRGIQLPSKINGENNNLQIKLVIYNWNNI